MYIGFKFTIKTKQKATNSLTLFSKFLFSLNLKMSEPIKEEEENDEKDNIPENVENPDPEVILLYQIIIKLFAILAKNKVFFFLISQLL